MVSFNLVYCTLNFVAPMTTERIDGLNILLVLFSLMLAYFMPFDLFLFSYAFLGPLHYLTEINWLKKRNYFMRSHSNWTWLFVVFAALVAIYPLLKLLGFGLSSSALSILRDFSLQLVSALLITSLLFSVFLVLFKEVKVLILAFCLLFTTVFLGFYFWPNAYLLVAAFIPTVIHVYLFTLLFVVYGALKSKSRRGIGLSVLIALVPLVIAFLPVDAASYVPDDGTWSAFLSSSLGSVNHSIGQVFGFTDGITNRPLSTLGVRIQVFIAFAYTYHYLNWFSKTSIIGWKKVLSKRGFALVVGLWLAAVSVYAYDFETGFVLLLFLSFLHVFMEFPLNVVTIKALFNRKAH